MNTPGILNAVNLLQSQAPAAKQLDAAVPEQPFKQVLSREMADRGKTRENSAPKAPESNRPAQRGQPAAPGAVKGKNAEPSDAGEVAESRPDDRDPAPDAASAEMQALVNNLVLAAAIAPDSNPPTDAALAVAPAAGEIRSIGSARKVDLPASAGVGQLMDQAPPVTAAGAQEIPEIVATLPDAPDLQGQAKAEAPALTESARPAVADAQVKAPVAAIAALQAAAQSAVVPGLPGLPNLPRMPQPVAALEAQSTAQAAAPELVANLQAGARPELTGKVRVPDLGGKGTEKKLESTDLAAGAPRINDSAQPPQASGAPKTIDMLGAPPAKPALELAAARNHEAPSAVMLGHLQQAAAFGTHAAAGHVPEKLGPPVGSPGWDQALGQKVVWMVAGGMQSASLTLNPPDLGPLQVVLNVSNSQATASFTAAQPEVRQALETAMPRLREMLADSGIQLGQSTVSAGTPNQYNGPGEQSQQPARHFGASGAELDIAAPIVRSALKGGGQGLIDTFA